MALLTFLRGMVVQVVMRAALVAVEMPAMAAMAAMAARRNMARVGVVAMLAKRLYQALEDRRKRVAMAGMAVLV